MRSKTALGRIKPIAEKWKTDYIFKTIASSVISFAATVFFALYNGFLGISLSSVWHGGICVFYFFLVMIRGMILLTENRNKARTERQKAYHTKRIFIISSVMLLMLNLALILPISLMAVFEKPVNIGLIPAIAMAAYTTYKITAASVHIRRQKRRSKNNALITELRTINFIDALVSVLTLQNTLITVNKAEADAKDMLVLSAVSSAIIYAVIICITVGSLIKGIRKLKISDPSDNTCHKNMPRAK